MLNDALINLTVATIDYESVWRKGVDKGWTKPINADLRDARVRTESAQDALATFVGEWEAALIRAALVIAAAAPKGVRPNYYRIDDPAKRVVVLANNLYERSN